MHAELIEKIKKYKEGEIQLSEFSVRDIDEANFWVVEQISDFFNGELRQKLNQVDSEPDLVKEKALLNLFLHLPEEQENLKSYLEVHSKKQDINNKEDVIRFFQELPAKFDNDSSLAFEKYLNKRKEVERQVIQESVQNFISDISDRTLITSADLNKILVSQSDKLISEMEAISHE